jgi:hypothetical protein
VVAALDTPHQRDLPVPTSRAHRHVRGDWRGRSLWTSRERYETKEKSIRETKEKSIRETKEKSIRETKEKSIRETKEKSIRETRARTVSFVSWKRSRGRFETAKIGEKGTPPLEGVSLT